MKVKSIGKTNSGSSTLEIMLAFAIFALLVTAIVVVSFGNEKIVHMEYVSDFSKFISVSVKPNFAGTPVKLERVVTDPSGLDSADSCSLVFGGGWENPNQSGPIYLC